MKNKLATDTITHFLNSNASIKAAALSYYTVFSFLPMILIITSVLGLLFGEQAVSGDIYHQLKSVMGEDAANQIQSFIKNEHLSQNSKTNAIIGFLTLALSATGMFNQMHSSLNSIWLIKAKPKSGILNYITKHLVSFGLLLMVFFLILLSTVLTSFLFKHADGFPQGHQVISAYDHLASVVVLSMVFALMYKTLGDAIVSWKTALYAGLFTSILFSLGKIGISKYLAHSQMLSVFGSASVLALIMLWVYYTAQIIFLGASFAYTLSKKLKQPIRSNYNSVQIKKVELED